jgi:adenylylsulfate kinase
MDAPAHIHPTFDRLLQREDKEYLLGQRGGVVWMSGMSGSGKSTLAARLERELHARGLLVKVLDGDNVRTGLNRNLGFSDEDRHENIRRIAEVAKLFADCGVLVVASFITPHESLRSLAREVIGDHDLLEVYFKASFEACARRDPKGLYAKAAAGQVGNFTGRDSSFEEPTRPDLVLDTESADEESCTTMLLEAMTRHQLLP